MGPRSEPAPLPAPGDPPGAGHDDGGCCYCCCTSAAATRSSNLSPGSQVDGHLPRAEADSSVAFRQGSKTAKKKTIFLAVINKSTVKPYWHHWRSNSKRDSGRHDRRWWSRRKGHFVLTAAATLAWKKSIAAGHLTTTSSKPVTRVTGVNNKFRPVRNSNRRNLPPVAATAHARTHPQTHTRASVKIFRHNFLYFPPDFTAHRHRKLLGRNVRHPKIPKQTGFDRNWHRFRAKNV